MSNFILQLTLKILFHLLKNGTLRFAQLKKLLPGITNTVLTSVLKKFEAAGIINRVQFNEIPPHVEYSLNDAGHALIPVFNEIKNWADAYLHEPNAH
ncbi:MAG: winged helix-turn-helix transcriptional regulator [Anaerovibrio sp.]